MNHENVMLWVEALRSGEYDQGHERLTRINEDGYELDCCLGVACKVAIKHGVEFDSIEIKEDSSGGKFKVYDGEPSWLPRAVKDWLGIDNNDPLLDRRGLDPYTATDLNDDQGLSFEQIASRIEAQAITGEL